MDKEQGRVYKKIKEKIDTYTLFKMNDNSLKDQVLDIKISTLKELLEEI